jgi:hypothetical protein
MEDHTELIHKFDKLYGKSNFTCRDEYGNTENVKQSYLDATLPKLWARVFVQEDNITWEEACETLACVIMECTSHTYFVKRAAAKGAAHTQFTAYCDFMNHQDTK